MLGGWLVDKRPTSVGRTLGLVGKILVGQGELRGERLPYEGLGVVAWVESPGGGNPEAPGRLRPQGRRTGRTGGSQKLPPQMGWVGPV